MKHVSLLGMGSTCLIAAVVVAELGPREGTFTGYYFTDRWGQGVFDIFFVKPELDPQLADDSWLPISVTCSEIVQPTNPGAAMIHKIEKVAPVDEPPLKITLTLDSNEIAFDTDTQLRIKVENTSDDPIEIYRRLFYLQTTVHKRGTHPREKVERDELYDSFIYSYRDGVQGRKFVRAGAGLPLLTNAGDIQMRSGSCDVVIEKEGKKKSAHIYDEDRPVIEPNGSRVFVYTIGSGWLVNEYELQVLYRLRENPISVPYILSPPVSFDVAVTN